jgi:outer membrane immunogenic protein
MKKLLLSSGSLVGLTLGATAADLPRRVVAPAPYVPVPVFTWTGFYVGVNAGYGWHDDNNDDFLNNGFGFNGLGTGLAVQTNAGLQPVAPLTGNNFGVLDNGRRGRDGFVGGGQVGYNYQFTPGSGLVIGLEADAQYADFRRNDDCVFGDCGFGGFGGGFGGFGGLGNGGIFTASPVAPIAAGSGIANPTGVGTGALGNVALFNTGFGNGFGGFGTGLNDRRDIEWFGTVRGRVGWAWDRLLVYATGGFAYTARDNRNDCEFGGCFGFGAAGVANGAALVNTGFYVNPAARFAGSLVGPTGGGFFFEERDNWSWGWTVGGGVEYAFTDNITAKIEGLYVNFDRDRRNNFGLGGNVVGVSNTGAAVVDGQLGGLGFDNRRRSDDFAVVRAGLNFKFGSLFGAY